MDTVYKWTNASIDPWIDKSIYHDVWWYIYKIDRSNDRQTNRYMRLGLTRLGYVLQYTLFKQLYDGILNLQYIIYKKNTIKHVFYSTSCPCKKTKWLASHALPWRGSTLPSRWCAKTSTVFFRRESGHQKERYALLLIGQVQYGVPMTLKNTERLGKRPRTEKSPTLEDRALSSPRWSQALHV